jgi:hypothetical protein
MKAFDYRIECGASSIEPMVRKARKPEPFIHKE